jgi:hypothetical protein
MLWAGWRRLLRADGPHRRQKGVSCHHRFVTEIRILNRLLQRTEGLCCSEVKDRETTALLIDRMTGWTLIYWSSDRTNDCWLTDWYTERQIDLQIDRFIVLQLMSKTNILTNSCMKQIGQCKGKAIPLQAWSGPEGSRKLRFPDFLTTAQNGGKVVSLTHRPHLPPGNTPGTHFC